VTTGHHHALELLERALSYTRVSLASVGADRSGPTPCAGWNLADLLAHMDDGLDAFLEAAGGAVRVPAEIPASSRSGTDLGELQRKACELLGVWSSPPTTRVAIGDRYLPSGLLVSAAALEITVHGWDVGQATGDGRDLPQELAGALIPVARTVVTDDDRPGRFGTPVPVAPSRGAAGELLGLLGRRT
jgi:uncharacterized protein (TIGR03086 family)